jgi:hypothetical protein
VKNLVDRLNSAFRFFCNLTCFQFSLKYVRPKTLNCQSRESLTTFMNLWREKQKDKLMKDACLKQTVNLTVEILLNVYRMGFL